MPANEGARWTEAEAARRSAELSSLEPREIIRRAIEEFFPGKIALVSSFGAESSVLLHMVSQIDKSAPVLFIDTKVLFPETLDYCDRLVAHLDLRNVKVIRPDELRLAEQDPEDFLWSSDPDRCCEIRKVEPLAKALEGYDAWITGRKRFQAQTRASLPLFENDEGRVKINPLAGWTASALLSYIDVNGLPRHPLVAKNFPSIGCIPCTSPVKPGEDSRAGRWRGRGKLECGLHSSTLVAPAVE
ncbi:phosphoadenylyl-sulfate reductase [Methylocapsa palsarum]|uniref:Adenosine 5'-phosphosulfate reductase n=1 Tax=Methylocapsa palsarum TaxID=1612308 RepID=A0A1I3ZJS2_9HYPH|nr:phosphoadenylyl-sulfate reductase [Methylocapsa palsarum]SFK44328.1 phosphoadenosine phosphosulfate reductase [Methylocapsa palsarum]